MTDTAIWVANWWKVTIPVAIIVVGIVLAVKQYLVPGGATITIGLGLFIWGLVSKLAEPPDTLY